MSGQEQADIDALFDWTDPVDANDFECRAKVLLGRGDLPSWRAAVTRRLVEWPSPATVSYELHLCEILCKCLVFSVGMEGS